MCDAEMRSESQRPLCGGSNHRFKWLLNQHVRFMDHSLGYYCDETEIRKDMLYFMCIHQHHLANKHKRAFYNLR